MSALPQSGDRQPPAPPELGAALAGLRGASAFAHCLVPLLTALGWTGDARTVAEALPHFAEDLDLVGLRNVMANLGYRSEALRVRGGRLDQRLLPCLYIPDGGSPMVLLADARTGAAVPAGPRGTAYLFIAIEDAAAEGPPRAWIGTVLARFRPLALQIALLTLLLYLIAIATPLFSMLVYDRVIPARSIPTLVGLLAGVTLALAAEIGVRTLRSRMLAYVGARLDMLVSRAVFRHILELPPTMVERAKVGSQVSRLKDFEFLRETFSGHIALTAIELPFALLFVGVVGVIGGWIAAVPVGAAALYGAASWLLAPRIRDSTAKAGRAAARRQEFLVEMVTQMRTVKLSFAEDIWLRRYREIVSAAAVAAHDGNRVAGLVQVVAQMVMIGSGIATVGLGAERVIAGDMSPGALIATMMLIWRILAPLQQGFVALTRLGQMRASVQQINALMKVRGERTGRNAPASSLTGRQAIHNGALSVSRVSMRYTADGDPVLLGVSFEAAVGERVVVVGPNGAGKSSLLKVLNGLYQPQAGMVRIDDVDIRQRDPMLLRKQIAYVPQQPQLFFGTVAQNLRLAAPTASDAELRRAAEAAGIAAAISALPDGFETRIGDNRSARITVALRHGLSLARAFLRDASVYLIDEAVDALDAEGDQALLRSLDHRRGEATVIMVTHRPSLMRTADRMLVLDGGILRWQGTPAEILPQLPKNFL